MTRQSSKVPAVDRSQCRQQVCTCHDDSAWRVGSYRYGCDCGCEWNAVGQREAMRAQLRADLPPGSTVYTVLRHVSRSGMQRRIDLYRMDPEGGEPIYLSGLAARVMDWRLSKDSGIVVDGCGMDMGFALVYELSYGLYKDGFTCTGQGCPSNDHSNGDRDYTPHHHKDGGYSLKQRWL